MKTLITSSAHTLRDSKSPPKHDPARLLLTTAQSIDQERLTLRDRCGTPPLHPTFPFPKKTLCVSVFYHLRIVYCVLQSFIFLKGVLLYRKAVYIALAFPVGLLHILNFTFSPKAFIASVVTAFCVDIILTISVQ